MRRKKIFGFMILCVVVTGILTGCDGTTSREKAYTETLMSQANDAIGNPDIVNFFEKAQLKEIYEMRDDPNALYSNGVTTSATWILSLDEKGDVYPRYEEREIAVSQTKIPKRLCEDYSLPEDY